MEDEEAPDGTYVRGSRSFPIRTHVQLLEISPSELVRLKWRFLIVQLSYGLSDETD